MVTIYIGENHRTLDDQYEPWVAQQITRRRQDGHSPCVRVVIKQDDVGLALKTPSCSTGSSGSGATTFNKREKRIIDLWNDQDLDQDDFAPGRVIAFLKQLEQVV